MKGFEEIVTGTLNRIEVQTTKTNGRVSSLEDDSVRNKVFQARITTAVSIIVFIVGTIMIPLAAAYIGK